MDRPATRLTASVRLGQLFPHAQFLHANDLCVRDAVHHSSDSHPAAVFAVMPGRQSHGEAYVADALAHGVAGLLVEQPLPEIPVPQCVVPDVRAAYGLLCAALAGAPSTRLSVVGVTGTNGKTTVAWMVRAILQHAGRRTGVLGTVEYHDGLQAEPSTLTTPDAPTLQTWLARMVDRGAAAAAIELSSHALHQDRAAGTSLQAALVTNITQDHFDYHETFVAYRDSKARIAELVVPGGVIGLNLDDPGSWSLQNRFGYGPKVVSFGLTPAADLAGQILEESRMGTRFRLTLHGRSVECATTLVGRHNVANGLAAAVAAVHLGLNLEQIASGLSQFSGVPGRLERIACGQPFDVFVDYAHTDDALRRCLAGLRSVVAGRLICVFGAGGDRDRSKRPLLGSAARLANLAIVTSDNPRSEDPQEIIGEILTGLNGADCEVVVEPDRSLAIGAAMAAARPDDCVLIAGKGHEREQIIGNTRLPFDDRTVVRDWLWSHAATAMPQRRKSA